MSVFLLKEVMVGTRFARKVREFVVSIAGKKFGKITIRAMDKAALKRAAIRAAAREFKHTVNLLNAFTISDVLGIYRHLKPRFPTVLKGIKESTFAEMVKEVIARGERSFVALRGLMVEKISWDLTQTKDMQAALTKVVKTLNKKFSGKWGAPRLVSNVTDAEGKQFGDLMLVATDPDGNVWIMAIIESKSFSNKGELSRMEGKKLGQHMWDWVRAKTKGLMIDGELYKPGKVVCEPIPAAQRASKDAVVGFKDAATRTGEMNGYYTQFIGFVPEELTTDQIRHVARSGIQVETWSWPFDTKDFNKLQDELTDLLEKAGF